METNIKKIISERLKKARLKAGLSQEEVRLKMGYKSTGTISQHENGTKTPQAKELAMLAQIYNVSISWLYGDEYLLKNEVDISQQKPFLTAHEQSLLINFRLLNLEQQKTILTMVAALTKDTYSDFLNDSHTVEL